MTHPIGHFVSAQSDSAEDVRGRGFGGDRDALTRDQAIGERVDVVVADLFVVRYGEVWGDRHGLRFVGDHSCQYRSPSISAARDR